MSEMDDALKKATVAELRAEMNRRAEAGEDCAEVMGAYMDLAARIPPQEIIIESCRFADNRGLPIQIVLRDEGGAR